MSVSSPQLPGEAPDINLQEVARKHEDSIVRPLFAATFIVSYLLSLIIPLNDANIDKLRIMKQTYLPICDVIVVLYHISICVYMRYSTFIYFMDAEKMIGKFFPLIIFAAILIALGYIIVLMVDYCKHVKTYHSLFPIMALLGILALIIQIIREIYYVKTTNHQLMEYLELKDLHFCSRKNFHIANYMAVTFQGLITSQVIIQMIDCKSRSNYQMIIGIIVTVLSLLPLGIKVSLLKIVGINIPYRMDGNKILVFRMCEFCSIIINMIDMILLLTSIEKPSYLVLIFTMIIAILDSLALSNYLF
ncbi:MAG: hypothetical protein MHMPM18_000550 [Marteilia pararefringens]